MVHPVPTLPKTKGLKQEREQYEAMCKTIGFSPVDLIRAKLVEYFAERGMPLYALDDVDVWLRKMCPPGKHWEWKPLRASDKLEFDSGDQNAYGSIRMEAEPYSKLVPLFALQKVQEIEQEFGKENVAFFVSDYQTDKEDPDPFLMVRTRGRVLAEGTMPRIFIFDAWDEPGFGIAPHLQRQTVPVPVKHRESG